MCNDRSEADMLKCVYDKLAEVCDDEFARVYTKYVEKMSLSSHSTMNCTQS